MSTISARHGLDILPEPKSPGLLRRVSTAAHTCWSAMVDARAAATTYHELIRRGATHEEAVREVFDEHFSAS